MIRTVMLAALAAVAFSAQAQTAGDPVKGKQYAETVCIACHGVEGMSAQQPDAYPNGLPYLAGQGADYLAKQLRDFQNGVRTTNPVMAAMAASVPPEDVANVAAWFAAQKHDMSLIPKTPDEAKLAPAPLDEAALERGKQLWRAGDAERGIPACSGCHGQHAEGLPAQYPALAGQFAPYLIHQLQLFASGERTNDPESVMRDIAGRMSENEMKEAIGYAVQQKP
jgi:cytochrome c553